MVFLTAINMMVKQHRNMPVKFGRVQQMLRFSWNFRGRKRNCYKIGIRYINKALMHSTLCRKVKKVEARRLWTTRINAACEEHGLEAGNFLEGLQRCDIQLDKKVLTDMAIYEPRTFKSLVEVSKKKLEQEGLASAQMPKPEGVITRGML